MGFAADVSVWCLGVWRVLFVGRWCPTIRVFGVETLIGFDTRPTRMDSYTRRRIFVGGSSDVLFQHDGDIYIVANSIGVSFSALFLYA